MVKGLRPVLSIFDRRNVFGSEILLFDYKYALGV